MAGAAVTGSQRSWSWKGPQRILLREAFEVIKLLAHPDVAQLQSSGALQAGVQCTRPSRECRLSCVLSRRYNYIAGSQGTWNGVEMGSCIGILLTVGLQVGRWAPPHRNCA